jgi:hypothetical protein
LDLVNDHLERIETAAKKPGPMLHGLHVPPDIHERGRPVVDLFVDTIMARLKERGHDNLEAAPVTNAGRTWQITRSTDTFGVAEGELPFTPHPEALAKRGAPRAQEKPTAEAPWVEKVAGGRSE